MANIKAQRRLQQKIRKLQDLQDIHDKVEAMRVDPDISAEVEEMFPIVKAARKPRRTRPYAPVASAVSVQRQRRIPNKGKYGVLGGLILELLGKNKGFPIDTNAMEEFARSKGFDFRSSPKPLINESLKTLLRRGYVQKAASQGGWKKLWLLGSVAQGEEKETGHQEVTH